MPKLRFHLVTLFCLITFCSLFIWANVRERIIISNSPAAFGLDGLVTVHIVSGWPVVHGETIFLVMREKADQFIREWPMSGAGGIPPSIQRGPLVANGLAGATAAVVITVICEFLVRRRRSQSVSGGGR